MLTNIIGQDKREKYLLIKKLIIDKDVIGIIYGISGIGKKFLINLILKEVYREGDRIINIEANHNWKSQILNEIGIFRDEDQSLEDFMLNFFDFLEKHPGRLFIVVNNGHLLDDKSFLEIIRVLGFKDKVSLLIIGEPSLREKLNPFKMGKIEAGINFIFELKPPEFEEFKRYFDEKYGDKITTKALKKLYKITRGSIGEAEKIIISIGKFPISDEDIYPEKRKGFLVFYFVPVLVGFILFFLIFNENKEDNHEIEKKDIKIIKNVVDKKLPEEGNIESDLPIKIKKKKKFLLESFLMKINDELEKELEKLEYDIPEVNFYKKPYNYILQVASFKNHKFALRLKNKLSQKFSQVKVINLGNNIKTVIIYASDEKEVDKYLNKLKSMGFKPIVKRIK